MKIEFTGRHMDFTAALKAHVEEHFDKIDHLFDGKAPKAHVIIEVERGMHRSEIVINWRNEVLTAESSIPDMYQSLSQTIGKIEKQARKLKDKVIDKSHKAQRVAAVTAPPEQADRIAPMPKIIKTDGLDSKPMSPDEAVLELEDTDQQFLIFRNSDNGNMAVMFRRKDGNYGIVQC
jgi:putative sigma-54 modulation protein